MFICTDSCKSSEGAARGHIAFVDGVLQKRTSSPPIIEGTTQWVMYVIDSSDNAHSADDTRFTKPGNAKINGVGRGKFAFMQMKTEFHWATQAASDLDSTLSKQDQLLLRDQSPDELQMVTPI